MYRHLGKRVFDTLASIALLAAFAPLLVTIALAIKWSSSGPIFFTQERIGRHGVPFRFIKFRTMIPGAEKQGAKVLCERDDPRVTTAGKLLRRFSLDELPQLINVLRGDMSIIGPRPGLGYQVKAYTDVQRGRLAVLPGITGWAQVNGRNSLPWDERIRLDLEYVARLSFPMDLKILIRTVRTVLGGGDQFAAKDYFAEASPKTLDRERDARA